LYISNVVYWKLSVPGCIARIPLLVCRRNRVLRHRGGFSHFYKRSRASTANLVKD